MPSSPLSSSVPIHIGQMYGHIANDFIMLKIFSYGIICMTRTGVDAKGVPTITQVMKSHI